MSYHSTVIEYLRPQGSASRPFRLAVGYHYIPGRPATLIDPAEPPSVEITSACLECRTSDGQWTGLIVDLFRIGLLEEYGQLDQLEAELLTAHEE